MGNVFVSEMKKNFDEDKFLIMREALSKDSCNQLTNAFEKFKTHSMFKLDGNPNNFSVTNSHRLQCVLYSNEFYSDSEENFNKIKEWFNYTSSLLFPILDPLFDNLFSNLKLNWTVQRITTMHVFPGCPEQQIHHDNDEDDNIIFITIPLHDTPLIMGPTIFYTYPQVKHLRKPLDEEGIAKGIYYNNLGYFKDFDSKNQEILKKARRQYPMKYGDYTVHRDITIHHGAANKSNRERKMLFIMVNVGDVSVIDFFEVKKGLILVDSKRYDKNGY